MSAMETHSPRISGIEIVGTVAAAAALLKILRTIVDSLSDAMSEKKATVSVLAAQLHCIIRDYELLNRPTPPAYVEVLLSQLTAKAQKLLKSVSAGMLRRIVDGMAHGKFETRIGKLRTGITDVGNTLLLPAPRLSPYQTSPALVQQHVASAPAFASASAPAFMQVTFTCPLPHTMDAAQALGGLLQDHIPVQAAPLGYPSLPPAVYSPAIPPVFYPTLPTTFYPSLSPPAYSYPPKY